MGDGASDANKTIYAIYDFHGEIKILNANIYGWNNRIFTHKTFKSKKAAREYWREQNYNKIVEV